MTRDYDTKTTMTKDHIFLVQSLASNKQYG